MVQCTPFRVYAIHHSSHTVSFVSTLQNYMYGKLCLHIICRPKGGTIYSAMDGPGGPILGGTTYSMTSRLRCRQKLNVPFKSTSFYKIEI